MLERSQGTVFAARALTKVYQLERSLSIRHVHGEPVPTATRPYCPVAQVVFASI